MSSDSIEPLSPHLKEKNPGNLIDAENHNKASRFKKKIDNEDNILECKCCNNPVNGEFFSLNCSITELDEVGISFPLFFNFIKSLWLLLLLGGIIVGIPCAKSNYDFNSEYGITDGIEGMYKDTFIQPGQPFPFWQSLLHSAFCILMIIYVFIFKKHLSQKSYDHMKEHISASDFTVWVKNLPLDYTDKDLIEFCEEQDIKTGKVEVFDVLPIHDIKPIVSRYQEYLKEKTLSQPQNNTINQTFMSTLLQNKEFTISDYQCNLALVTFTDNIMAKDVRKLWKPSTVREKIYYWLRKFFPYFFKIKGKIISYNRPPEPSDIIWDNFSRIKESKVMRRLLAITITLIIIFIVCLLVYEIKKYQYTEKTESKNASNNTKKKKTKYAEVQGISALTSLLIITFGIIISITVRWLSEFERNETWTSYFKSLLRKLILATSSNSIGVLLITNMVIWNVSNSDEYYNGESGSIKYRYGLPSDLFWLMLADTLLSPLSDIFSPPYMYKLFKRWRIKNSKNMKLTQSELNAIWENPKVDMAQRYANYLKNLLIVFVFAPLSPLVFFFGLISIIPQYWVDKYLILRRYSKSPSFRTGLSKNALQWMSIVIAAYSISNLLVCILVGKNNEGFLSVVPYLVIGCSLIYLIIPLRCSCFRINKHEREKIDYSQVATSLDDDYQRSSIVTKTVGYEKWAKLCEKNSKNPSQIFDILQERKIITRMMSPLENIVNDIENYSKRYGKKKFAQNNKTFLERNLMQPILGRSDFTLIRTFLNNPDYLTMPTINEE